MATHSKYPLVKTENKMKTSPSSNKTQSVRLGTLLSKIGREIGGVDLEILRDQNTAIYSLFNKPDENCLISTAGQSITDALSVPTEEVDVADIQLEKTEYDEFVCRKVQAARQSARESRVVSSPDIERDFERRKAAERKS